MKILLLVIFYVLSYEMYGQPEKSNAKVSVHFVGEVVNPGRFQSRKITNLAELKELCGGWTKWAKLEIIVIRFPRSEGLYDEGEEVERAFLSLSEVTNNNNNIVLSEGDIIYVPMKSLVGR